MGHNRYHKRRAYGTKNYRKRDEEIASWTGFPERDHSKIPFHELAQKYKVTLHAVYRFAERILKIKEKEIEEEKMEQIAKTIVNSLPKKPMSGARYNIFDNYFAVVKGDMVVTIVEL